MPDPQQMAQTRPKSRRKCPFWRGSGAPGQEAEKATRARSVANGPNLAEIPSKKFILEGFWAPDQDAENAHQGQSRSKWPKLVRNPIEKAILDGVLGHLARRLKSKMTGLELPIRNCQPLVITRCDKWLFASLKALLQGLRGRACSTPCMGVA